MPGTCKFWQSGTCKFGSSCRFDHPNGRNSSKDGGGGFGNNNTNNNSRQGGYHGSGTFGNISRPDRWHLNTDDIRSDLTSTRPAWILSSYGPGKDTPASLFKGSEFSPEEVRLRFLEAQANGKPDEADREAIDVWQKADTDMQEAAGNIPRIAQYMEDQERQHPNRYDFTNSLKFDGTITAEKYSQESQLNAQPGSSINPFGNTVRATPTTNPFVKPAFGDVGKPNPFAQPAKSTFGQPAQPSAFGASTQPSPFGQPTKFGQAAQPSTFGAPAFGQPAASSVFGQIAQQQAQPSAFGQTNQPSAFGQPAQPSAFGKTGFAPAAFGQAAQASGPSTATPAFGQTGFGTSNTNNHTANSSAAGFTAGSGFGGGVVPGTSPFNQAKTSSPFLQASSSPAFGQSGTPQNMQSPFGQRSDVTTSQTSAQNNNTGGFAGTSSPAAFGQSANPGNNGPLDKFPTAFPSTASNPQPKTAFGTGFGPNPLARAPISNGQPAQSNTFGSTQPFRPALSSFGSNPLASRHNTAASAQPSTTQQAQVSVPAAIQPSDGLPRPQQKVPLVYAQSLPNVPSQRRGPGDDGDLTSYKGLHVGYEIKEKADTTGQMVLDYRFPYLIHREDQVRERIWFPNARADIAVERLQAKLYDIQVPDDQFTEDDQAQYKHLFETGSFNGKLPLVPPPHSWIDYDF